MVPLGSMCSVDLIPGLGSSPGEGNGYLLQYPGLENSMDYSPWGLREVDMTGRLLVLKIHQSFTSH